MGPIILLDKSALQSLSQREIGFLTKHYYVNISPVIIYEILGDLSKFENDQERSNSEVAKLARKVSPFDSMINTNSERLIVGNLLGADVEMDGRIIISGANPIVDSRGKKGLFIDEEPEREVLRQWQRGLFSENEEVRSKHWRMMSKSLDLEDFKKSFKKVNRNLPKLHSFSEVKSYIEETLAEGYQSFFLDLLFNLIDMPKTLQRKVDSRWRYLKPSTLQEFAPYAHYYLKVILSFYVGLASDLISTRPTNRIDLEYLFYLPFCQVFSSGDTFLISFSRIFIENRQDVISSNDLKTDLKVIADEWDNLSDEEKKERSYDYGSYPLERQSSFTSMVWKKHMKPWKPGSGNRLLKMSEEEQHRLIEELRPMSEAIDNLKRKI